MSKQRIGNVDGFCFSLPETELRTADMREGGLNLARICLFLDRFAIATCRVFAHVE